MSEIEPTSDPIPFRELSQYLSDEQKLPISNETIASLEANRNIWMHGLIVYDETIMAKTGLTVFDLAKTQLHHYLAGSNLPLSMWLKLPYDLPGGEYQKYIEDALVDPKKYVDEEELSQLVA